MAPKKPGQHTPNGDHAKVTGGRSKAPNEHGAPNKGPGSKKRKAQDEVAKPASKASRRSGRGAAAPTADPIKVINFLLSENAVSLCRPKNETEDIESRGKQIRTYGMGDFSPFEELICALILSRPIR